jgi:phasin
MPTPSYEIPSDMRDMAEKSVDQASRAFDGFISAAQKAAGQADSTASTVQANAKTIGTKAMGFAEANVRSAFDLARKLVRAKDLQEVLALQTDYAKTQMTTIQEQAKELGGIVQTTAQGVAQSASASVKSAADQATSQTQV